MIESIRFTRKFGIFKKGTKLKLGNNEIQKKIFKIYLGNKYTDNIKINVVVGGNGSGKTTLLKSFFFNTKEDGDNKLLEINGEYDDDRIPLEGVIIESYSPFDGIYDFIKENYDYKSTINNIEYLSMRNVENTKTTSLNLFLDMCKTEEKILNKITGNLIQNIIGGSDLNIENDYKLNFKVSEDFFSLYIKEDKEQISQSENTFLHKFIYDFNKNQGDKKAIYNHIGDYYNFMSKLYKLSHISELETDYKTEKVNDLEKRTDQIKDMFIYFIDIIILLNNTTISTSFIEGNDYSEIDKWISFCRKYLKKNFPKKILFDFEVITSNRHNTTINKRDITYENTLDKIGIFYTKIIQKLKKKDIVFNYNLTTGYGSRKNEVLLNTIFLSKFDINLNIAGKKYQEFSSGQKVLFYRFFHTLQRILNQEKTNDNFLILIDEPDLHLHLDRQRRYIKTLVDVFSEIKDKKLQFIITTHSPFIISDISKDNLILLEKGEIKTDKENCFGANYVDLIRNGFFFQDKNLIGNFSENVIGKIADEERKIYQSNKNDEEKLQKLQKQKKEIIGDEFLRDNLLYFKPAKNDKN